MTERLYDALVIGGGPAGASAALLLAQAGWSVVLLERKNFPRKKVCGEYLSATNLPLLGRLGIGEVFHDQAGPPIRKVGLFAGSTVLQADLPRPNGEWGRALSREKLDTLLLDRARHEGADIRQPWKVRSLVREGGNFACGVESLADGVSTVLKARIVVAAHGSWDPGTLLTQPPRSPIAPDDLFGFKAHFQGSSLAHELMPLLAFPGGYGGMVRCEENRVSLSCCVRRDQLTNSRHNFPGEAGDAVLGHIRNHCLGVRTVLEDARLDGSWLSAGPIRPGIRLLDRGGIFAVGNAAGEAHPIIAEGISIALQSAWLLCSQLISWKRQGGMETHLGKLGRAYVTAWRRQFAARLYVSQMVAHWAMRPVAVNCSLPLIHCFPAVLSMFARLSGKAHDVISEPA